MSLGIFWFLPTSGDTCYLGHSASGRPTTNAYMRQIAVAADQLGYDGQLLNLVSGGDATELETDAVFLAHDERYATSDELLSTWQRLLLHCTDCSTSTCRQAASRCS